MSHTTSAAIETLGMGFAISLFRLFCWLILLGIIFVPLERLFSLRSKREPRSELAIDVAYFFINGLLPVAVLSVPLAAAAIAGHHFVPAALAKGFAALPFLLRLFLALAMAEIGLYWGHRLCHEIPVLWRFHAVHHSPTHVDWLVNSRGHPVDFIFTRLCGLLPLYLLGIASPLDGATRTVAAIVMLLGPMWGFFIHADIKWRFGPLEWLIATPAFHRWHHTNDDRTVIDKNFAPTFPWIDRLFGTLHLPVDRQPRVCGTNLPVASSLLGQITDPFLGAGPRPHQ